MESKDWPLDPAAAAAAVAHVIEDLDVSNEDQRDALLYELIRTAWGTVWALDQ
jgi:hypothetical protein